MSSSEPAASSTSKATDPKKAEQAKDEEEAQPHLGVLEEDDEFEEFPVAGEASSTCTHEQKEFLTVSSHRLGRFADRFGPPGRCTAGRSKVGW